jgi:hypothetical protein
MDRIERTGDALPLAQVDLMTDTLLVAKDGG